MVINTNIPSQSAARLLMESSNLLAKSLARLSSGSRIVSPEDDAAGAAVSLKFDAQISRTNAAKSNVGNAISYSQTQDGFLRKVGKALDRMSELSILAQDTTKTATDINLYQTEFGTLQKFIAATSSKQFNGVNLFDTAAKDVTTDSEGVMFTMTQIDLSATGTQAGESLTGGIAGAGVGAATGAIALAVDDNLRIAYTDPLVPGTEYLLANNSTIRDAITALATDRATVGANITRLNYTSDQLAVLKDNLTAANSRMKDVDVAEESTEFARFNILVQAGTAMLAQANSVPSTALRLLQ